MNTPPILPRRYLLPALPRKRVLLLLFGVLAGTSTGSLRPTVNGDYSKQPYTMSPQVAHADLSCITESNCPDPTAAPLSTAAPAEVVAGAKAYHLGRDGVSTVDIEPQQATTWHVIAEYVSNYDSGNAACDCDDSVFDLWFDVTYDETGAGYIFSNCRGNGLAGPIALDVNCGLSSAAPFRDLGGPSDPNECFDEADGTYNSKGHILRVGLDRWVPDSCQADPGSSSKYYLASAAFLPQWVSPSGHKFVALGCSEDRDHGFVRTRTMQKVKLDAGPFECYNPPYGYPSGPGNSAPSYTFRYKGGTPSASTPTPTP